MFIVGHVDVYSPSFFLENLCSLDNMRYVICFITSLATLHVYFYSCFVRAKCRALDVFLKWVSETSVV